MISPETILVQHNEPLTGLVDGEVVMMSISAGAYFGLNSVGTEIWSMLQEPLTVSAICDRLHSQYEVDRETVTREVSRFAEEMLARGLLRVVPTSALKT